MDERLLQEARVVSAASRADVDRAIQARDRISGKLPKRERAKRRRRIKRLFNLSRRECGAIGAGHLGEPTLYRAAVEASGLSYPKTRAR